MILQLYFLRTAHFWLMIVALLIIGFGVYIGIQKKPKKSWYLIHRISTATALIITIIAMLIVNGPIFSYMHPIVGFIAITLLFFDLCGGFYILFMKKPKFRLIHIWMGRLTGLLLITAVILGILIYL